MTTLLVANDGGHLRQLYSLAPRLPVGPDRMWVTPSTPQSRSLLEGEKVLWVDRAPTRDGGAALRNAWKVSRALGALDVEAVVSTGSSLAVSVLPQARLRGLPAYYIESATRVTGPSLSGRLLSVVPGIRLYTQYPEWASRSWAYRGSVFDGYAATERPDAPSEPQRVVVSLGTSGTFGFRRLVERLLTVIPPTATVLWQTGCTDVSGLAVDGRPVEARPDVPAHELQRELELADVVVAHAGTGIALSCLDAGRMPVLVPRRPEHREHVDDHQQQIAGALGARGLAIVRELGDLQSEDLRAAARHRVSRADAGSPFRW